MAALSVLNPTLLDWAKTLDPNGRTATIVEILSETNEVLDDMAVLEGNLPTGHRTTVRTGIPTPTWRKLYGFVQPSKGTTTQVTDNIGMLEAYAEVDKDLAELNGNTAAFRLSEDRAHIEGMNIEMADTLFYGNEGTEPEAFTGLAPRYNLTTADNGDHIILGGSADTDNGSIWLVVWGPNTVHTIFPKGSKAGLQMTDKGLVTVQDTGGTSPGSGRMEAYLSHYQWKMGLSVRDWRYAVRIANIEKSALTKDASSGADLPDLMFQAMRKVPNLGFGRPAFYMSRDMATFLGRQTINLTKNSTLTAEMVGGKLVERFHGIPVRRCDALSADEALIA